MFYVDIDECQANSHNCDSNATCTNTPGSFTCACNSGYTGDGESCTGIVILFRHIFNETI